MTVFEEVLAEYQDVALVRPGLVWFARMATQPPRRRINFRDVAIGERFYDPISAEYFVKQSENLAAMVTGIGNGKIPDEFEPDDVVGIDLN